MEWKDRITAKPRNNNIHVKPHSWLRLFNEYFTTLSHPLLLNSFHPICMVAVFVNNYHYQGCLYVNPTNFPQEILANEWDKIRVWPIIVTLDTLMTNQPLWKEEEVYEIDIRCSDISWFSWHPADKEKELLVFKYLKHTKAQVGGLHRPRGIASDGTPFK